MEHFSSGKCYIKSQNVTIRGTVSAPTPNCYIFRFFFSNFRKNMTKNSTKPENTVILLHFFKIITVYQIFVENLWTGCCRFKLTDTYSPFDPALVACWWFPWFPHPKTELANRSKSFILFFLIKFFYEKETIIMKTWYQCAARYILTNKQISW